MTSPVDAHQEPEVSAALYLWGIMECPEYVLKYSKSVHYTLDCLSYVFWAIFYVNKRREGWKPRQHWFPILAAKISTSSNYVKFLILNMSSLLLLT